MDGSVPFREMNVNKNLGQHPPLPLENIPSTSLTVHKNSGTSDNLTNNLDTEIAVCLRTYKLCRLH